MFKGCAVSIKVFHTSPMKNVSTWIFQAERRKILMPSIPKKAPVEVLREYCYVFHGARAWFGVEAFMIDSAGNYL